MKTRYKILIVISIIFVSWTGVTAPNMCIFVDGPTPDWLGSHNGCGPLVTYEIQNYFGILWEDPDCHRPGAGCIMPQQRTSTVIIPLGAAIDEIKC